VSRQFTRDFLVDVEEGKIDGISVIHKFGRNDSVPNGSFEFINQLGMTAWPLSAPTPVRIKAGGDAADVVLGDGAREVIVEGIDSNFNEVQDSIITAGASASSATASSFWRIHRAWVSRAGTYGEANTAAVIIENSAGGTDLIRISTEEGQSQFGGWTVPIGKTAHLLSAVINVDGMKAADIRMFVREEIDNTVAPLRAKRIMLYFDGVLGALNYETRSPAKDIPEKSDIWWEAQGSGANTEVSVDFELLVVNNVDD